MRKKLDYLSVTELAELLGVSLPTLREMRKTTPLGELEVRIGKRVKFLREDVQGYLAGKNNETTPRETPLGQLEIVSRSDSVNLRIKGDVIDLRGMRYMDPYGTLSLLTYLVQRSREKIKTGLLVEASLVCKKLQYVGFFDYVDQFAPLVEYDRDTLKNVDHYPSDSLLPITVLRRKGEEKRVLEQLGSLFVQQEFSEEMEAYIGWLLGELADNSLTHGGSSFDDKICFIQAQRYTLGEEDKCIIIGIADLGQGIHVSLKKNPKYKSLSDPVAALSAFKHNVSSWEDKYKRGNGLTDVITIAMGNNSLARVSTGGMDFQLDFQNKREITRIVPPLFKTKGTRVGILYREHDFEIPSRKKVDQFLNKEIKIL